MNFQFMGRMGLLFFALTACVFGDDKIKTGVSTDYSEGYYGASTLTTMTSTSIFAKYIKGDTSLRIDLPYLILSGPSNTSVSSDSTVTTPSTTATQYRETQGVGDIVLNGIYQLYSNATLGFAMDLGCKLKIPTASHRAGLGTGEFDESTQLYVYQNLNDVTLMLEAGYKWVGNPQGIHYRNTVSASAGIIYQPSTAASLGALFDIKQSVYSSMSDQMEITLYGSYQLSPSWYAQLHTYKGLADISPTFGVGGTLGYQF